MITALTNKRSGVVQATVRDHYFEEGVVLCNIFAPKDCVTIDKDSEFKILLMKGETKLYLPRSSLYFDR